MPAPQANRSHAGARRHCGGAGRAGPAPDSRRRAREGFPGDAPGFAGRSRRAGLPCRAQPCRASPGSPAASAGVRVECPKPPAQRIVCVVEVRVLDEPVGTVADPHDLPLEGGSLVREPGDHDRRAVARPAARASRMLMLGLFAAACSASAGGSSASPTQAPLSTPTPAASSLTALDAAALVVAQDPRFAGIGPRDPSMVGQGSWYEVAPSASGWSVTVQLGWGDCQAGCISRHTWTYAVTAGGAASVVSETGDPLPAASGIASTGQSSTSAPAPATAKPAPGNGTLPPTVGPTPTRQPAPTATPVPTATSAAPPSNAVPATGGPWIIGTATAGPVCPVERYPPDPACAPRPVAGATITVHGLSLIHI